MWENIKKYYIHHHIYKITIFSIFFLKLEKISLKFKSLNYNIKIKR